MGCQPDCTKCVRVPIYVAVGSNMWYKTPMHKKPQSSCWIVGPSELCGFTRVFIILCCQCPSTLEPTGDVFYTMYFRLLKSHDTDFIGGHEMKGRPRHESGCKWGFKCSGEPDSRILTGGRLGNLGVNFRNQSPACTALHCLAKSKGGAIICKQLQVELLGDSEEEVAHRFCAGGA
jgi:hypothetical protein